MGDTYARAPTLTFASRRIIHRHSNFEEGGCGDSSRKLNFTVCCFTARSALFIFAAFANQIYRNGPDKVAGNTQHAAEILARN